MKALISVIFAAIAVFSAAGVVRAQADEMCREFGETPSREIGRQNKLVPYIYGRILIKGLSSDTRPPRVTIMYQDIGQSGKRQPLGNSGNYCFRRSAGGGTLIIEVDGVESARKSLPDLGTTVQREDFEIYPPQLQHQNAAPGLVSIKPSRLPNEKTNDLYKKAAEAEKEKDLKRAIGHVKEIVSIDAEDFIAWAKLGSLYLDLNSLTEAEGAFNKALEQKADYTPALLNLGMIDAFRKNFPEAIVMFRRAADSDPASARAFRFLGEAYLQNRQGTLGLAALDTALRLDPIGMAECHLLKARLYDLAGARSLATTEYKLFLTKIKDYPDKKKLEQYIRDNPEQ